jgi:hypothetical protein
MLYFKSMADFRTNALNNFRVIVAKCHGKGHFKDLVFLPQSAQRFHKDHQEKNFVIFVVLTLCTLW